MKPKILVIDDEVDSCYLLKISFEMEDYLVTTANSATEACDLLSQESFDIILSDINMREGNGFDLLEYLSKSSNNSKTPVVMMTASIDQSEEKIKSLGASALILKPFEPSELIEVISKLL